MNAATTLDPTTAGIIRQALAAASSGNIVQACQVAEQGLHSGADAAALHAMLGMLHCRSGDLDRGIPHLRTASELRPGDLTIATNLAAALVEGGEHGAAMEVATEERAKADPSLRLARFRAFAAQSAERFAEAVEAYEHIVAQVPDDWEAWNNLGNARTGAGDVDGAVEALRRALDLNAESPPIHLNYALAQARAGNLQEAEQRLRDMAARFPHDEKPLRELHALLKDQGRDEEALNALEAAIERAPADVDLWLALASHRLELIQTEAAERAYREALRLEPAKEIANLGLAVVFDVTNRTAELASLVHEAEQRGVADEVLQLIKAFDHRRAKRFAEGLAALERVPEDLEPVRRYHLLGQLHEGVRQYEEAFKAYARMNEIQSGHPTRPEQRGAAYRQTIRKQLETLTGEWAGGWQPHSLSEDHPSPAFLVGFPRSGTTLLDTMLMGHPQVEVLEEEPALVRARRLLPQLADLPRASHEQIREAQNEYFRVAADLTPLARGKLLIDKNPLTMNAVPMIKRLFPDARIILALRHPCDVVLSCFVTNFTVNDGKANFLRLDTAAELYDLSFTCFERASQLLQPSVHRVTYENVVADAESELRSLLAFLGLEWRDEVLAHEATALGRGRIKTASYAQVAEPLYHRSAGRWQHYRKHLEPILPVLVPWVQKFGYTI
jgi:Flp pilus assembly protein TadD